MSIPRPTSAPSGGGFARSAGAAAGRGVLLVVLALALGVLLLSRAIGGSGAAVDTGAGVTTTTVADTATTLPTETTAPPATAAPPPTHPPAQVKVLVLNGRSIQGIAGSNNEVLLTQNFNTLSPDNTPSPVEKTVVTYTDPAYATDATTIAGLLGIPPEAVAQADTGAQLGVDTKGANVIVLLGADGVGSVQG